MSSCTLHHLIGIQNLNEIHQFLFQEDNDDTNAPEEVTWEDGWSDNWEDVNQPDSNEGANEETSYRNSWIQDCSVSISPTTTFMAIAYQDKAVFLEAKSDPTGYKSSSSFVVSWKGVLQEEPGEIITDILCLPLVSLKRSSHGSTDWTCVVVGFSSGYVRMYTETGSLIISQLLHELPVVQLNCRTYEGNKTSHNNSAEVGDELTILYNDTLIVIDGFSLFQTLRACRNQVALAAASGMTSIDPPPLSYKKWILRGLGPIKSHVSPGTIVLNPFDQMHTASILGGFNATVSTNLPTMSQYVTVGTSPFVGFLYALDGTSQPLLSHVALAVASKLKSALFNAASGWLSWGKGVKPSEDQSKQKPKVELGTPLDIRSGLPDLRRQGHSIVLAPSAWLGATTDSFGRVMLVDLNKGYVMRVWKGYRDAQIAFVRSHDDTQKHRHSGSSPRSALFLVIYAPRRGLLEIWSCINGPRVGAFNISKNARLLCPGYKMFGMNNSSITHIPNMLECCVLGTDGEIQVITVPFHLALSDPGSHKARDIHLLKKVGQLLHKKKTESTEIVKLLLEMRLPSFQQQGVVKLMQSKSIEIHVLKSCLEQVLERTKQSVKRDDQNFVEFLQFHSHVVNLYEQMSKLNDSASYEKSHEPKAAEGLVELLNISKSEADNAIQLQVDYLNSGCLPSVLFKEDHSVRISEFISCISIDVDVPSMSKLPLDDESKLHIFGKFIFHSSLFGNVSPHEVLQTIDNNIQVSKKDLLRALFVYWQENERLALQDISETSSKLLAFVNLLSRHEHNADSSCDSSSSWWAWIRTEVCVPSMKPFAAYLVSLVCRSVAIAFKATNEKGEAKDPIITEGEPPTYEESCNGTKESTMNMEWETLWVDLEHWNLVVTQLEDCVAVNTCIGMAKKLSLPEEAVNVSVHDLLNNGPGFISELVARVVSSCNLHPNVVDSGIQEGGADIEGNLIDFLHTKLQKRFPVSLSSNTLHAHCCWEDVVAWNKDPEVISLLSRSVAHIEKIKCDPHVQHGLALLAWHTFVGKRFLSLAKLIDKVGKSPKDRLCRKDVGISDSSMSDFCRCCNLLLQTISDVDPDQFPHPGHPEENDPIKTDESRSDDNLMYEDAWRDAIGKQSIVEMSREQLTANYELVQHNMHLCFILHSVMEFNLRGVKPLTRLFDTTGLKCFTDELTSTKCKLPDRDHIDLAVSSERKQFLTKLVTASVASHVDSNKPITEMKHWVETSLQMASEFQLDRNMIQLHYVNELFRYGLDNDGYEASHTVSDVDVLGSTLILIVGQRLSFFLLNTSPDDGVILLSQMPPTVSTWIRSQDHSQLAKADVSIDMTHELAQKVAYMLPEHHSQYSMGLYLLEAASAIKNS
ncbi:rab3 GTPase-activating protein non-catalytic subunit [Ciona intestinalis]